MTATGNWILRRILDALAARVLVIIEREMIFSLEDAARGSGVAGLIAAFTMVVH